MGTANGSDLLAQKEGVSTFAGAPLVQDSANIATDIENGDWTDLALDSGLVGLDVLGVVLDPFGALFGEVAGFIIEHIGFLNQFMDDLTGDPQGIEAASATWKNISANLLGAGEQYQSALGSVDSVWSDPASEAYTVVAQAYITGCNALGGYAELFSEGITVAGMICAKTRQDVYDLIGDLITDMVIEGLAALASSWFTFGGTIAAWIAAMEIQGDLAAASISDKVAALLGRMGKFAAKFAKDAEKFAELSHKLTAASKEFEGSTSEMRSRANEMKKGHTPERGGSNEDSPLNKHRGQGDVGVRGARDENKAHQGDSGEGEGGE